MSPRVAGGGVPGPYFSEFVEGRRGEVLDAALAVFAEKGYECGTMREIAGRLGVTEPALYRHYPSKEALFADLVGLAGDRVVAQASTTVDAVDPEHLRESLAELIQTKRHVARASDTTPIMRTLLMAAPHNAAFQEVFRARLVRPMVGALERLVPRVDRYYDITRSPAELTSSLRAFMSLFVGYFMTGAALGLPHDDEAILDAMMAIMRWGPGCGVPAGSPAAPRPQVE